jgi:cytochrome b6
MMREDNPIYKYLDERFQIKGLIDLAKKKKVPLHYETIWYYFGGIALFLFIIQIVTGMMLLVYYRASSEEAYESVRYIISEVKFGWLVRSVHSWSANLMIFAAFVHMFSVFFSKAYRKPRELTWLSGFLLLVLALSLGFTGYLLPWNQLSFFATKVGTDIVGVLPVFGHFFMTILRGGEEVSGATLTRFFGAHAVLLPILFAVILGLHLLFVQRQGMSEPFHYMGKQQSEKKTMPFFPNFILRDLLLWLLVFNVLALLAVFFPWELGKKADLFAPAPQGIRPEWYFMFMFQTLKLIPAKISVFDGEVMGILGFGLGGLLWMLVPFWDRKSSRGLYNRKMNYLGLLVLMFMLVMTILGYTLS